VKLGTLLAMFAKQNVDTVLLQETGHGSRTVKWEKALGCSWTMYYSGTTDGNLKRRSDVAIALRIGTFDSHSEFAVLDGVSAFHGRLPEPGGHPHHPHVRLRAGECRLHGEKGGGGGLLYRPGRTPRPPADEHRHHIIASISVSHHVA
jgi:hypothetical protein